MFVRFSMRCRINFVLAILLAVLAFAAGAQTRNDAGDFDIEKVRKAVAEESYTSLDDSAAAAQDKKNAPESYGAIMTRIVGYLILVIFLIVAVFWVLRKTGLIGASRIGGGSMDVLEALALGQGRNVIMIRVLDKVYVLAQSAQQINVLEKIDGDKALEVISSSKGESNIVHFKDMVNSFLKKKRE